MVFGTPTILRPASVSRRAAVSVPSPPIAMIASMPLASSIRWMFSGPPPSPSNGLVRLEPRMVPPCFERPRTSWRWIGMKSPSTTPFQPQRKPTNSASCEMTPFSTDPRMTAFRPGQSPPLVRIPIFMVCSTPRCSTRTWMLPEATASGRIDCGSL